MGVQVPPGAPTLRKEDIMYNSFVMMQDMNRIGLAMFKTGIEVKKFWADCLVKEIERSVKEQNEFLDSFAEKPKN